MAPAMKAAGVVTSVNDPKFKEMSVEDAASKLANSGFALMLLQVML